MAELMDYNLVGTMVEKKVYQMAAKTVECLVESWDARMAALMVE